MLSDSPEAALWLTVPDNCWMRGEFEVGHHVLPDIHILLGSDRHDKHLLFEREALERFVTLAQRMLAVPVDPGTPGSWTLLDSTYGHEISEQSRRSSLDDE